MSKYHLGDEFVVEIKEVLESNNGTLYRSNFSTLVFDDYGLDKLQKYDEIGRRLELIDELKQAEYNRGLADAWELAKKIYHAPCEGGLEQKEIEEIFDCKFASVTHEYTAEEAIAKIEAYEKEKEIKVGDVVKSCDEDEAIFAVAYITIDKAYCGILKDGSWFSCRKVKKTGKHIDIESLLKQIGE